MAWQNLEEDLAEEFDSFGGGPVGRLQAVKEGLLPRDPGKPARDKENLKIWRARPENRERVLESNRKQNAKRARDPLYLEKQKARKRAWRERKRLEAAGGQASSPVVS